MTLKVRDIKGALTNKGFSADDTHHTIYWFFARDKKTSINTKISQGEREIGDPLIALMARQMRLTKGDFVKFVSCEISGEEYLAKLQDAGHVTL